MIGWIVTGLLAGIVLGVSYILYRIAFRSPNGTQNDDYNIARTEQMEPLRETIGDMIEALSAIPYEKVAIPSDDGLRLTGRYYHQKDGAPVVIAFHGYRGTPFRDFSGGTDLYFSEGFNLLLAEQRAHCGSEGRAITFGVKERIDCQVWIDYVRWRFEPETPILLAGISMGAATVLMSAGPELPDCVKGIVADSPYTSPKAILRKVCGDIHIPAAAAYPFLWLGAHVFGGFGLTDANAAEAVKHTDIPVLLIHGEDDRFVPCDMSREIAAANPNMVELHTFPGAGHGLSFFVDRERYESIVHGFLNRVLDVPIIEQATQAAPAV